jgi:hypothetical protein
MQLRGHLIRGLCTVGSCRMGGFGGGVVSGVAKVLSGATFHWQRNTVMQYLGVVLLFVDGRERREGAVTQKREERVLIIPNPMPYWCAET